MKQIVAVLIAICLAINICFISCENNQHYSNSTDLNSSLIRQFLSSYLIPYSKHFRYDSKSIIQSGFLDKALKINHFNEHHDDDDDDDENEKFSFKEEKDQKTEIIKQQLVEQINRKFFKREAKEELLDNNTKLTECQLANRSIIYGLRCDEGAEVDHDGVLIIKANEPTKILLIGRNLDVSNLSLALTPKEGYFQQDCTHIDRVKSYTIHNISSTIAQMTIDLPSPGSKIPFYLCLRGAFKRVNDSEIVFGDKWFHQGPEPWLKVYIKQDFLPLYMKIIVIASLLMLSGLFSGLNLGLMALDKNELQVIISCGSETEKRYARAIEPVRRRGNYLLCSILFSNVLVNSTIAVLLEELTSGIVAVMTSTIFIVMFGEILPQAFCSRHGLAVGAKTVSITYFCMIVTLPLSYPVSCCLDWALGEEIGHAYDRERLMEFIKVTKDYNNLETDEVNIISGALKLKRIHLNQIMTRIEDVFMLDIQASLDFDTIQKIMEKGYSRIPVHEAGNKKNIVALLFAKDLALLDPDDKTPLHSMISLCDHPIMYLFEDTTLDLALNEFKTGKSHMAFVRRVIDDGDRDPIYELTGIVTLEDVIEEIMQMEINDETDTISDNRRKKRRKEAQVRKDFSQFTNLGCGDLGHNVVTPQLCLAAYQYLATTVEPFNRNFISDTVLKRLLSQKIYYKVHVQSPSLQTEPMQANQAAYQTNNQLTPPNELSERRLYVAGQAADYFIMILEGRVHVVCGKENLVFDGGAFNYFGTAALSGSDNQQQCLSNFSTRKDSTNTKQQQQTERRESVVAFTNNQQQSFKPLSSQFSSSMKKLEATATKLELDNNLTTGTSNSAGPTVSIQMNRLKGSESMASIYSNIDAHNNKFVPDYTVEIVTDTSYLKITRNEYLAALKATLVERGVGGISLASNSNLEDESNNIVNTQIYS